METSIEEEQLVSFLSHFQRQDPITDSAQIIICYS